MFIWFIKTSTDKQVFFLSKCAKNNDIFHLSEFSQEDWSTNILFLHFFMLYHLFFRSINRYAKFLETTQSKTDLNNILDLNAYDGKSKNR
jgi:hypothetical protein